jgi:hypothetical protein
MLTPSIGVQLGTQLKVCRTCRGTMLLAEFAPSQRTRRPPFALPRVLPDRAQTAEARDRHAARRRAVRDAARREGHRAEVRRHRKRYPAVIVAGQGLQAALRAGQVRKSKTCQARGCSSRRLLQAHHHSHAPEHWLEVLWLCFPWHRKCHAVGFIQPKAGIPTERGLAPDLEPLPLTEAA